MINGGKTSDHHWEYLVPDKNPESIYDIIKETALYGRMEYGISDPTSHVFHAEFLGADGIYYTVEVSFGFVEGVIKGLGSAWVVID